MSWVLPGVLLVLARDLCRVRVLMALDFPALERPQNATSAPRSAGHSDSFEALVKKLAEWKFIDIGELFGSCRPTEGTLLYNAGRILPDCARVVRRKLTK